MLNIDELKKVVRGYEAVIALAEAVEKNAALARGIDENERLLAAKRAEVATALGELDAAKAEVEKARSQAIQLVSNARAEANELLDEASASASEKVAKAERESEEFLGAAREDLAKLEEATAEARKRLDVVNAGIAKAEAEREAVQGAIADLKAKLGA